MRKAIFSRERRAERARQEGYTKGFKEGYQRECEKFQKQAAEKMLTQGMEIGTICDVTDLTFNQVEQLRNELD